MSQVITADSIAEALRRAIPRLACELPCDVARALDAAHEREDDPLGCFALGMLCENARIAACEGVPLCQDTGSVQVCLEMGPDVSVPGDVFAGADAAVAEAYAACGLRKSLLRDALFARENTGDNTPAFCELRTSPEPGARLRIMLKGGGSDNASRVVMLAPGAGRQGIIDEVLACVREKAANACPPLVIGIGLGTTFDKVAGLAKRALFREVGTPNAAPEAAALERELLEAVNATGIGAGGMGGAATALAVHVESAPCHIAALPLAINMGCNSMRRMTLEWGPDGIWREPCADEAVRDARTLAVDAAAAAAGDALTLSADHAAPTRLTLPLSPDDLRGLRMGDTCLISGPVYTLRDAGHKRLLEEMDANGQDVLPYGLQGQAIFYAGPTPPPVQGGRPFGAIGPTTASRMDFAAPRLYRAGIVATIGKGRRSNLVREACAQAGAVYFTTVGGAAALLARCAESSEIIAYDDLGTEALRRVMVRDLPVIVSIDAKGCSFYG